VSVFAYPYATFATFPTCNDRGMALGQTNGLSVPDMFVLDGSWLRWPFEAHEQVVERQFEMKDLDRNIPQAGHQRQKPGPVDMKQMFRIVGRSHARARRIVWGRTGKLGDHCNEVPAGAQDTKRRLQTLIKQIVVIERSPRYDDVELRVLPGKVFSKSRHEEKGMIPLLGNGINAADALDRIVAQIPREGLGAAADIQHVTAEIRSQESAEQLRLRVRACAAGAWRTKPSEICSSAVWTMSGGCRLIL
jgi:hypothetical protein